MDKNQLLAQYLPKEAAPIICRWIDYFQCEFTISRSRTTKLGDYRHPFAGKGHKISVNNNLNQFAFLVTTVHEFAHLLTWNEYKNSVRPHGDEWKYNFKRMMEPFYAINIFPEDINNAIKAYVNNPSASSCSDLNLARTLKKYDHINKSIITVESLPIGTVFKLNDGRFFQKGERLRKRYKCICLDNKRMYLFNPLAEISPQN